jgi:hypothetical protein
LTLLVLGIALADDANYPATADDLAVLANRLDARTYLQVVPPRKPFREKLTIINRAGD